MSERSFYDILLNGRIVERETGLEPATFCLGTDEPLRRNLRKSKRASEWRLQGTNVGVLTQLATTCEEMLAQATLNVLAIERLFLGRLLSRRCHAGDERAGGRTV